MRRQLMAAFTIADRQGLTPDVVSDNSIHSDSYWRHEIDYTVDMVRYMRERGRGVAGCSGRHGLGVRVGLWQGPMGLFRDGGCGVV